MTTCNNFGYEKKEVSSIKDFIESTKQYSEEVKIISKKISTEVENMEREMKAFNDAYSEIKSKHNEGLSMSQIKDSYVREQEQSEITEIEDEILDLFSKKLKSLKQNLNT